MCFCRVRSDVFFTLLQVVSAYTNAGLSLVDTSMVPFRTAYPMIVILFILILGGNTAFVSRSRVFTHLNLTTGSPFCE